MDKNQIFMIAGTDYPAMTKTLLTESGLAEQIKDPDTRIVIKPNLVNASYASEGATTHPEIVSGIVEYLKEHGFHHITLMESSWVGASTDEAFFLCGYADLCRTYDIPFVDIQKEKSFACDCAGLRLNLSRAVKDIDFLINVPVLKGHCQTKITCALKNLKGLLPNPEKRRFHSMGLHKPIAHLNAAIRQDFIVADNICGDLDFEDGGNPVVMNRILAARDPVLIDAYVCHLMHYDISDVPYIEMAQALGVGSADISGADIRVCAGDCIQDIPVSRKVVEVEDIVSEVESCSACYGYLLPALDRLKEQLEERGEKMDLTTFRGNRVCIGQGYRGKSGELGVGNCTRLFRHHLDGCPPTEDQIFLFLKEYIDREFPGS